MRRSLSSIDSRNTLNATLSAVSLGMLPVGEPQVSGIVMKGTNSYNIPPQPGSVEL